MLIFYFPNKEKINLFYSIVENEIIRIIVGGGDGTVMWVIDEMISH